MSAAALATILGMALATYATRVLGYLLLRNRQLAPRTRNALERAPGCVMLSVIVPYFVSSRPEELIAIGIAVVCAWRLSMLPTMVISVASLGILKALVGA